LENIDDENLIDIFYLILEEDIENRKVDYIKK